MILRPLQPSAPSQSKNELVPAWEVVQRTQSQKYQECWLITQPSHAALAGELAAKVSSPLLPNVENDLVRAIALHDAGWGVPDAQTIMRSRSVQKQLPESFIQVALAEYLAAWDKSIDVAQSVSPAGGYIVSAHFCRIAESRLAAAPDRKQDRSAVQKFLDDECKRQKKLAAKQAHTPKELEQLTELLQFCDLLSLYMCCDAREKVVFPEYFGVTVRLVVEESGYQFDPPLIERGARFSVAALRHPATKEVSSQEMVIKVI
ncbi:MAG TPA: DUF3891 family protein [Verrucomicrobiae bacterium]|jgi:hypothetical protein|nr:DUF3891 family protein [Verrucomicrobiae bacterium]